MRNFQNLFYNIRRASNAISETATAVTPSIKEFTKEAITAAKTGWNGEHAEKEDTPLTPEHRAALLEWEPLHHHTDPSPAQVLRLAELVDEITMHDEQAQMQACEGDPS